MAMDNKPTSINHRNVSLTFFIAASTSACVRLRPLCIVSISSVPTVLASTCGFVSASLSSSNELVFFAESPDCSSSCFISCFSESALIDSAIRTPIHISFTFSTMYGRTASLKLPITWRVISNAASCWSTEKINKEIYLCNCTFVTIKNNHHALLSSVIYCINKQTENSTTVIFSRKYEIQMCIEKLSLTFHAKDHYIF